MPLSTQLANQTASTFLLTPQNLARLRTIDVLGSLDDSGLQCLADSSEVHFDAGDYILRQGELSRTFWLLLSGSVRVSQINLEGHEQTLHVIESGTSFGEIAFLANMRSTANLVAQTPCTIVALNETAFWNLMHSCPKVREIIVGNMAQRLAKMQSLNFQQEKMAALGTLAAGLMHELNNPCAAARRASSQLRTNLTRLHQLATRFSNRELTGQQKSCLADLQDFALHAEPTVTLSSLDQADAEDALAGWMEEAHIEDAWRLAPTLVSIGIDEGTLACARSSFDDSTFSDALNWLEALVSSMQLVGTVEESISRVTDLVQAVKSYAYEGKGQKVAIDLNHSIHATLVILAHKIREKQITLEKSFAPDLPALAASCQNLNQIWTNLLDNAIDAVPQEGRIRIRTGLDRNAPQTHGELWIEVEDNGPGIPLEDQSQIFDPFFTTKPVGVGTGLGLGIVYRIIEQCGGTIRFTSGPGSTIFTVRLPASA
jgi:signal transduction histidine kinase